MPLLYYWLRAIYNRSNLPSVLEDGLRLQQNSKAFGALRRGDRVWAFTRSSNGTYALAGQTRASHVRETPNGEYGCYTLDPLVGSSVLYIIEGAPSVEPLIRSLSINRRGKVLGRSFQGRNAACPISVEDDDRLAEFAGRLQILSPASPSWPSALASDVEDPGLPPRQEVKIWRVIRDTVTARRLKALHQNRCQICGEGLTGANGWSYSEAHHIRPLGEQHGGPDEAANIIVLCPNHHALCDYGAIPIVAENLIAHPEHAIRRDYTEYHNTAIYRGGPDEV